MPGEDHIGRGFAVSGVGVDVAAQQFGRLRLYETAPKLRFGYHLVARRKIEDNRRSVQRVGDARRLRDPQIFAQLDAEGEIRIVRAREQELDPERNVLAVNPYLGVPTEWIKMPQLVKFGVVRKVLLRYDPEDLPAFDHGGGVIEFIVKQYRQPYGRDYVVFTGRFRDTHKSVQGRGRGIAQQEQILTGIACKAQFGQNYQPGARFISFFDLLCDTFRVEFYVRDLDLWRRRGNFDKSVFHFDYTTLSARLFID